MTIQKHRQIYTHGLLGLNKIQNGNQPCLFFSGGLAEEVDEKILHAAFIPFGEVIDVQIPLDYATRILSIS